MNCFFLVQFSLVFRFWTDLSFLFPHVVLICFHLAQLKEIVCWIIIKGSDFIDYILGTKKMIQMARKWQKQATKHKIILWWEVEKGHFAVYNTDNRRFVLPLMYLENIIFKNSPNWQNNNFVYLAIYHLTFPVMLQKYIITLLQEYDIMVRMRKYIINLLLQ